MDLILRGGRVIDPASGLDATCDASRRRTRPMKIRSTMAVSRSRIMRRLTSAAGGVVHEALLNTGVWSR